MQNAYIELMRKCFLCTLSQRGYKGIFFGYLVFRLRARWFFMQNTGKLFVSFVYLRKWLLRNVIGIYQGKKAQESLRETIPLNSNYYYY